MRYSKVDKYLDLMTEIMDTCAAFEEQSKDE